MSFFPFIPTLVKKKTKTKTLTINTYRKIRWNLGDMQGITVLLDTNRMWLNDKMFHLKDPIFEHAGSISSPIFIYPHGGK